MSENDFGPPNPAIYIGDSLWIDYFDGHVRIWASNGPQSTPPLSLSPEVAGRLFSFATDSFMGDPKIASPVTKH